MEHRYGTYTLQKGMKHDRDVVIALYKKRTTPVVDTSSSDDLMLLLNANSYEKGSWELHMLRRKLGNEIFQKGIQTYYADYKGKTASTGDFMHVMEKVSRQNLEIFFKQWLYTPGHPVLQGKWNYNVNKKTVTITIKQMQDFLFQFPLEVAIRDSHSTTFKTFAISNRTNNIELPLNFEPIAIITDPNINLLYEGNIVEEQ